MNKSMTVNQDFPLVNAKYKLNTSEMKFILNAIAQIDSIEDEVLKEYEIKVSELEAKLQAEQNTTRLKQFAKKLMSKPLEVPTQDGGFIIFNWFSKIRYYPDERLFRVRIDEDLKPYLLQLKERFVSYNLKYILPLTSTYSVRIYQFLKEYEKLTKRYFEVEELMELLQVPKSYRIYNRFKEKVLKVAEKELKEHCDIYFTIEEEKEGRKVSRLIFRIYKNTHKKEAEEARLFDAQAPKDYTNLLGMNCKIKGEICEHLLVVTPLADGSITCSFRSGESYRFETVKALLQTKI